MARSSEIFGAEISSVSDSDFPQRIERMSEFVTSSEMEK